MLEEVKKQLIFISLIGFFFLLCVLAMILFADPFKIGLFGIAFFYISLIVFCISVLTLFFYSIRFKSYQGLHAERLKIAYREAGLLTFLIIGSLFLSSKQILFWWIELIFILAVVSVEIFFLI